MKRHLFHLVDRSPWPFLTAFSLLFMTTGTVMYMHFYLFGGYLAMIGFIMLVITLVAWWRDVIRESTYLGYHSTAVQRGLKIGFILFIASEIMFFAAFFWAFFHSSLVPSIWVGAEWPPVGLSVFSPYGVPLLNTLILLTSGASITWAHRAVLGKLYEYAVGGFVATITLAILFILMQLQEYVSAPFGISDGVYGSAFYMLTGLHGLHVIVGTIFLIVCFIRFMQKHLTPGHHLGFEFAAWYWHFVDVVWLFLYFSVYCWGNWIVIN